MADVLLSDIVDALGMQFDEMPSFLDLDTGQVETVSSELLREAEETDDPDDECPDDLTDDDEWEIAKRIVSTDRFVRLPSKFDIHQWQIMEDFTRTLAAGAVRGELEHAIHGAGAFRHFKSTLRRHRIEKNWFAFQSDALKQIAIDWCEEHQIKWR
jgi:hypothetical protein